MLVGRPWLPHRCWLAGAALLALACSEEKPPPPQPTERELGPREVELDPSGALAGSTPSGESGSTGAKAPRASEADLDTLMLEDPRQGAYQTFLEASDRELQVRCKCNFAELGHPSADECFERLRRPELGKQCELAAFSRYWRDLGPRYACLAQAREDSATCIESNGCGALATCEATRDTARRGCGGLLSADIGFSDLELGCERSFRLGSPSGCPDAVVTGAALGQNVFEGNTTAAGDDVTLSCHQNFDNFDSPDLVVQWQAPAAGYYLFSTENSAFVTQIGILDVGILDGCGGAELGCASSSGASFGGASLALPLEAQQIVLIVLEGYDVVSSGYVRLQVSNF